MRCGVQSAINFYSTLEIPHSDKCEKLRQDILNNPYHYFGQHDKCQEYFCRKQDEKDDNMVPLMKQSGLFDDICFIIQRLANNSESLVLNMDTNAAENYNSIVAKYTGGKRINYAMRNSYETRCEAAVISYNQPHEIARLIHKRIVNRSPGRYIKRYIFQKQSMSIKRKVKRKLFEKTRKQETHPADGDYGPNAHYVPISQEEYEEKKEAVLDSLKVSKEEIERIARETIGQSSSLRWHDERAKRLTASSFGKICKQREATHCQNLVKQILYSPFSGNKSTKWGKDNESIAVREFCLLYNTDVMETGLIIDEEHHFLGASPDGLLQDDGLIEVKCPHSASAMTPKDAIKNGL